MENTVNTDLIRDHVDSFILRFLAKSDSYGYDIHKAIATATEGVYQIKQPTLYSCLKRLEKQGFISSYDGETSNGAQRKYYAITDKGRAFVEKDIAQWEFSRTLLDRLLSDKQIDLATAPRPFDPSELRPRTKRGTGVANAVDGASDPIEGTDDSSASMVESTAEAQAETQEIAAESVRQEESAAEEAVSPVEPTQPAEAPSPFSAEVVQMDFDSLIAEDADGGEDGEPPILQEFLREKMADGDDYLSQLNSLYDTPVPPASISAQSEEQPAQDEARAAFNYGELKERAQSEGYRLHPYSKAVSTSYYSMNFFFSSRLRRDALLLLYAVMFLEVLISYFALDRIAKLGYLFYIVMGSVLLIFPIIGIVLYLIKPDKRIRADFDLKMSLSGMIMLMINLIIISMLFAFFLFGADLAKPETLVTPLLYPALLFIDLPIYTLIYAALYGTKRYHLK